MPDAAERREIAAEFQHLLAFPNRLGAMDEKPLYPVGPYTTTTKQHFQYLSSQLMMPGITSENSDGGTLAASASRQSTPRTPEDSSLPGAEHLGAMACEFLVN